MRLSLMDMFCVSVKLQNTSGSLGEQELHWGCKPIPFFEFSQTPQVFQLSCGELSFSLPHACIMLINSVFTENNLFTLTIKMYM